MAGSTLEGTRWNSRGPYGLSSGARGPARRGRSIEDIVFENRVGDNRTSDLDALRDEERVGTDFGGGVSTFPKETPRLHVSRVEYEGSPPDGRGGIANTDPSSSES